MKYLVAALIGLALIGSSVAAQDVVGVANSVVQGASDVFYRLSVVTTDEHIAACVKAGGKGAYVFELDETGAAASEMQATCLVPVK